MVEYRLGISDECSRRFGLFAFEDCLLWTDKWLGSRERDGYIRQRYAEEICVIEVYWKASCFSHGDGSKRLRPAKRSGQPAMEGVATTDSGQADHVWTSSGKQPCR